MHKFINEYGDLIGSYKTEGLGDSTGTLRKDIRDVFIRISILTVDLLQELLLKRLLKSLMIL